MKNLNETLPDNLKNIITNVPVHQAMPLGEISSVPYLGMIINPEDEKMIEDGGIVCELKPSILNIDFAEHIISLCFVQFRLNSDDKFIYTAIYDLKNKKHYDDCDALLNMKKYGLFIASPNIHDFVSYDQDFRAEFDPRAVLLYAKEQGTDYPLELFLEISYALNSQASSGRGLWDYFDALAPFERSWYGRMSLSKDV